MKKTIIFKQWICLANLLEYPNGATAIQLVEKKPDPMDPSPIATASVNIVKEHYPEHLQNKIQFSEDLPKDQCYIKTWSENEGILESLMEARIISPLGAAIDVNGQGSMAVLVQIIL